MTRRFTHALAVLYGLVALALLRCAAVTQVEGNTPRTLLLAGASLCLAVAIVHHSLLRDELRYAHARIDRQERATRPPDSAASEDGVVAVALAAACCERWWTSAGAEHDPDHCTRKDQTT